MDVRRVALGIALLTFCRAGAAPSDAQSASPSADATTAATPAPAPCASTPPDLPAAFAYDLQNPKILRFISRLANVPAGHQQEVFDAAVAAAASPIDADLSAAVAPGCSDRDEVYGGTRAFALLWYRWKLDDLDNHKKFDAFVHVVSNELSALALGDELSLTWSAAAATPFALLKPPATNDAAASPAASSGKPCANHQASTIAPSQPDYPATAALNAVSGLVEVKVRLNASGDVESASLFRDGLSGGPGTEQLIRHTIYAADLTTYAPEVRNCTPVPGSYLFTADYMSRTR